MKCDFCGNNCVVCSFIDCTEEWITIVTGGRLEGWKFPESKYLFVNLAIKELRSLLEK